MSQTQTHPLPSSSSLFKATAVAVGAAAILLVTMVLPAEYGMDPTGVGRLLGLDALKQPAGVATAPVPVTPDAIAGPNAVLAAKADAAFGKQAGRSLDASAVSLAGDGPMRRNTFTVTLAPGKGAEVKAHLRAGEGLTFNWQATAAVAVDMHGEAPNAKNAWTSYSVESAQKGASGTFVAPFEGSHGWYWQNRGTEPVTVSIEASGFQSELYRP